MWHKADPSLLKMLLKALFIKVIHLCLVKLLLVTSVPHCVIAGLYNSIMPLSRWTSESLDNILQHGDKLYKSISKTNELLQVNDISPQITAFQNTYNFYIGREFFGTITKQQSHNHIGSTLEKATFSVIQENKTRVYSMYFMCGQ